LTGKFKSAAKQRKLKKPFKLFVLKGKVPLTLTTHKQHSQNCVDVVRKNSFPTEANIVRYRRRPRNFLPNSYFYGFLSIRAANFKGKHISNFLITNRQRFGSEEEPSAVCDTGYIGIPHAGRNFKDSA